MSADAARSRFGFPKLGVGPQVIVLLLVLGLVGAMAIEPTRQLLDQRRRIEQATHDVAAMERSNARLQNRIRRLNDPDYIDQLARAQSGLVKPGEIPYVVMPPSRNAPDGRRSSKEAPPPAPPPPSFMQSVLRFIGI